MRNSPGHSLNLNSSFETLSSVTVWSCNMLQGRTKSKQCLVWTWGQCPLLRANSSDPGRLQGCALLSGVVKFGVSCSSSLIQWSQIFSDCILKDRANSQQFERGIYCWNHQHCLPNLLTEALCCPVPQRSHLQTHALFPPVFIIQMYNCAPRQENETIWKPSGILFGALFFFWSKLFLVLRN